MTNLSPFTSPFIAEDTPTMGGILTEIDNITDLSDTRRRDLKSDVRSLCRLLGKHPSEVPANINWLHVRVRRIVPAAHDISKKRLSNIKSGVLKALALTGCSRERSDWLRPPSSSWQNLLSNITDKHDLWKLTQFAQYCTAIDIEPCQVTDVHIFGLLKILTEESFTNKPDQVVVNAVKT